MLATQKDNQLENAPAESKRGWMTRWRDKIGLRVRLILLILLAILPALGIMLYTAALDRQREARQVEQEVLTIVRLVSADQERVVEGAQQLLIALAQLRDIRSGDPSACSARLSELLKLYPGYNGFGVARPDGEVFCSTVPLPQTLNVSERPWFQRTVQTGKFAAGDYQVGRITGQAIIVFSYPAFDTAGQLQAVIFAALPLITLNQLAAETPLPDKDAVLTVIHRDGTILGHFPEPEVRVGQSLPEAPLVQTILAQKQGVVEMAGLDGVTRLYAFTPLYSKWVETGVYLSVGISRQVAFAEANRILRLNLLWLGLGGLIALVGAWFGSDIFVLRRVKALVQATERLRAGDLSTRTGLAGRAGEIGQLARSFDEMADALEQREAEQQRAEAAVREQREWFRVTLASIGDAVIATDTQGQVTFMNPVAEALTSWSYSDAEERPLTEIFKIINEETRQPVDNPALRALREGLITGLANHTLLIRQDGSELPIDDSGAPIQDEAGQIFGAVLIFRDITERRRTEAQLRTQREAERVARAAAEAAAQRLEFLAEASAILAASLDYETTLKSVAGLAVPHLADWCTVHIIKEDGSSEQVALAHADPAKVTWAHELQRRYPAEPNGPRGVPQVLRTGRPEFTTEIPDELLVAAARDPEHLHILQEVGLKSYMIVPLTIRERTLGAITFIAAESGKHYGPDDLTLLTDLAYRAALAIDNARLYREAQQLNEVLEQRVMARTAELQAAHNRLERELAERRHAEEALQKSEARFRTIFTGAALGISLLDLERRIIESNPALQRMLGYSGEELRQKSFTQFIYPADAAAYLYLYEELVAGQRDQYQLEKRYIHKEGRLVWGHLTISLVRDTANQPQFALAMIEDITGQKQIEAELAEVQRRLMESREEERLYLAQELHDGPVQELYGLAYRLSGLEPALPDETYLAQLAGTRAAVQQVIRTLRTMASELRPPTLAPFGLEKAIRSHAEHFQASYPELTVQLDLTPDGQALPERVRLALFRIYQEALNNIIRHAGAHQIRVRFEVEVTQVILEVQDDGRGFEVPQRWISFARQGHLGLVGISERAGAIGGQLQIISAPGAGTVIRVIVPRAGDIDETG